MQNGQRRHRARGTRQPAGGGAFAVSPNGRGLILSGLRIAWMLSTLQKTMNIQLAL